MHRESEVPLTSTQKIIGSLAIVCIGGICVYGAFASAPQNEPVSTLSFGLFVAGMLLVALGLTGICRATTD